MHLQVREGLVDVVSREEDVFLRPVDDYLVIGLSWGMMEDQVQAG